jgi:nitrite reductase/ring-hydroxylating ferredoxin subunit
MLSPADNETLVRVGPGTPMGDVMRRYWRSIALSNDLPKVNSDPLRVKLLGEYFVLFRDSEGRVGMLDELCMHRGASLALGRVEEGGIRCLYHGWKYAIDGTILETANHQDCRLRRNLKAKAYPVIERSDVVWVYIGPKEHQPPFRTFAADMRPDDARFAFRVNTKVNYLALWEGASIVHTSVRCTPIPRVCRGARIAAALLPMARFGRRWAILRRRFRSKIRPSVIITLRRESCLPTGRAVKKCATFELLRLSCQQGGSSAVRTSIF